MKRLIVRVLALFGLVPARAHARLSRAAADANDQARTWKKRVRISDARADKIEKRAADLEKQLTQNVQALKDTRGAQTRTDAEWKAMQTRLVETERALALAREHLMAIEVKLDILEGAANVLDARTRTPPPRPNAG